MPPEDMKDYKEEHVAYLLDADTNYIELLVEAYSLYKKLNTKNMPREIRIREDRMAMWQRLINSLEDWMEFCLYGDFVQKMRKNKDMDARQFVLKYLTEEEA